MEIFWNTIAQYNEATWWTQLLITAAGILLTTQLYRKPTLWAKRSMKIYMVFLNAGDCRLLELAVEGIVGAD